MRILLFHGFCRFDKFANAFIPQNTSDKKEGEWLCGRIGGLVEIGIHPFSIDNARLKRCDNILLDKERFIVLIEKPHLLCVSQCGAIEAFGNSINPSFAQECVS